MNKALRFAGLLVLVGVLSGACDDVDRAIEQRANEVLGNKTEEPAATAPTPAPAPIPEPAAPTPEPTPEPVEPAKPVTTPKPAAEPVKPIAEKPKATEPAKVEKPKLEIAKPVEPKPAPPAAPEPAPTPKAVVVAPEKPATKVTIPQSSRVKINAPARVQDLLNADPRMQPWLNNTIGTIEACYDGVLKSDAAAAGTIAFALTMHENSRPDADITALPPQLSGIVACATGKLMRGARMPLFTGKEGEQHTVKVKFTP